MKFSKHLLLGLVGLALVMAGNLFGADEFEGLSDVVTNADTAARTSAGVFIKWAISLAIPIATFFGAAIFAYVKVKRESQQEPSAGKLVIAMILAGVGGIFAYMLLIALISKGVTGDVSTFFTTIQTFWKSLLS